MTNDHPYDDLETFALGGLESDRQRAVLDHADGCPTCAVLLADAMNGVGALAELEQPLAVTRSAPGVGVVRSLRPARSAPLAWLAGAAAAACLALLLWNVQLRNEAIGAPHAPPIGALVHSHFIHHPLTGPVGTAKVIQAVDGHWIYVLADGLTPNARYDLWETRHGGTIKVGDFVTDRAGMAAQYFEQAPGAIEGYAVASSDKTPTQDPQTLHWP
jgi:hypothetical protein